MLNYRQKILARVDREPPSLDVILAPRAAELAGARLRGDHDMDPEGWREAPEAVLRAEGCLAAFRESRTADAAAILATDYAEPGGRGALDTFVALLCMADRLAEHAAHLTGTSPAAITREAARIVGAVAIEKGQ